MKKVAAALAALALMLSATCLAFRGVGYPAWDGTTVPDETLCASFGTDRIQLNFDPSADYSNVADGVIQACFFAFDAQETNYLELYLFLPQNLAGGDVLRSDESSSTIYLYESSVDGETFYRAGFGGRDSDGSGYEMKIESVENGAETITVQGEFSGTLCRYEREQPTRDILTIGEAYFSFTLPLTGAAPEPSVSPTPDDGFPSQPGESFPPMPEEPGESFPPLPEESSPAFPALPGGPGGAPAFTLPPDYVTL